MNKILIFTLQACIILSLITTITSCASGPTAEEKARWAEARRIKAEREERNTDLLVELFMNEIWNRPIKEFMENKSRVIKVNAPLQLTNDRIEYTPQQYHYKGGAPGYTRKCHPSDKALDSMGLWVHTEKIKSSKSFDGSVNGERTIIRVALSFPWLDISRDCKYATQPQLGAESTPFLLSYSPKGIIFSQQAWTLKNKLASKGVPLIYCTQGIFTNRTRDPDYAWCTFNNIHTTGESFDLQLSTYRNTLRQLAAYFYITPQDDINQTFAQIYMARFQSPKYLAGVMRVNNKKRGIRQKRRDIALEEEARLDARLAAEERRRKKARSATLHSSFTEAVANFNNSPIGLADPKIQALGNNNTRKQTRDNKEVLSYIPRGEPSPALLNQRYQTWCAERGGSYDERTGSCKTSSISSVQKSKPKQPSPYEFEKQNCLKAGKTWREGGGCNYANDVAVKGWSQGNRAKVQSKNTANSHQSMIKQQANNSTTNLNETAATSTNSRISDINKNCCYDIGLSDKAYDDALEKAKAKAKKVCARKGEKLEPIDLFDEQVPSPGFKFKSKLTYKCGVVIE
ncbi:hypothetical protein ACUR5C_10905 [Aliikangiella sp. IMCC44653]